MARSPDASTGWVETDQPGPSPHLYRRFQIVSPQRASAVEGELVGGRHGNGVTIAGASGTKRSVAMSACKKARHCQSAGVPTPPLMWARVDPPGT